MTGFLEYGDERFLDYEEGEVSLVRDKQQEHARRSWQRLRSIAAEELADYLEVVVRAADDLIQEQFYRVRVSVMVWDESGVPVFDTQCGSLDEHGALRIPPLDFSQGVGWQRKDD